MREAEEKRIEMYELPRERFTQAHALFGDDVLDALSARSSVAHREAIGGTGPKAVREQIEAARAVLQPAHETPAHGNELVANVAL